MSHCAIGAVMHNEPCEDSWRSAGFRVIKDTCFLASCAHKGHRCRNEMQADPMLLLDDVQSEPPSTNVSVLRSLVSGVYTSERAEAVTDNFELTKSK